MIGVRLIGAVLVLVGAAYVSPPAANATTCVTLSTAERLKRFPAVFEATVTSERLRYGQILTVDVKRVWKGDVGRQRTLLHRMDLMLFPLVVGQTYLIFASEYVPGDTRWDWFVTGKDLTVASRCEGIIPIERAGRVLNELGPAPPSPSR